LLPFGSIASAQQPWAPPYGTSLPQAIAGPASNPGPQFAPQFTPQLTPVETAIEQATTGGVLPTSVEADLSAPPMTLEQQVAAMGKRLDSLEKPAPKFPGNITVSGVFQADGVVFSQDDANRALPPLGGVGPLENGADFRRARIGVRAAVANNMNAFMQFDFAFPGRPTFTDVWVEWTDLPWLGTVRVGQWKQPFSLEVVSSFRYTTFMERSSLFQAFTPFRHLGVGFYNHADDLMSTWALSYMRTGQDQFGDSLSTDGGNGMAGRLTHLMWYDEDEGRSYLHVGGAYFLNVPPHHAHRIRSIPEIFVGENRANGGIGTGGFQVPGVFDGTPFFVDTGALLGVDHVHTFGVEGLWVYGPLSLQTEAMAAMVDQRVAPTATLDGAYMQVGYFLTGEHRPYDRINGAIDRVKPFEDFFLVRTDCGLERGIGAWEVAMRFSHIDLNDATISGGQMDNLTLGLNWFCNPNCKVVFNYIHSWRDSPTNPPNVLPAPPVSVASQMDAFGLRAQVDF